MSKREQLLNLESTISNYESNLKNPDMDETTKTYYKGRLSEIKEKYNSLLSTVTDVNPHFTTQGRVSPHSSSGNVGRGSVASGGTKVPWGTTS